MKGGVVRSEGDSMRDIREAILNIIMEIACLVYF